jgi:hypothetical protein
VNVQVKYVGRNLGSWNVLASCPLLLLLLYTISSFIRASTAPSALHPIVMQQHKMNSDSKPPAFDFNKVQKCIQFSRQYEEDIHVVPFRNLTNGEEADEGEGEPAGLQVTETKQIYYMKSRWPKMTPSFPWPSNPNDGKMFTRNGWESYDEEGSR